MTDTHVRLEAVDALRTHIEIMKCHPLAKLPDSSIPGEPGIDIPTIETVTLPPGKRAKLRSGLAFRLLANSYGVLYPRGKVADKKGLIVTAPLISPNHTGEIMIAVFNASEQPVEIRNGDKLVQLVLKPMYQFPEIKEVDSMPDTNRSKAGINEHEVRL